jgi:hypothetical protein
MKRFVAVVSTAVMLLGATAAFAKAPQYGHSSAGQLSRIAQYPFALFAALQGNPVPLAIIVNADPPTGANEEGEQHNDGTKEVDGQNNNNGPNVNEGDGAHGTNQDGQNGENGQNGGGN